MKLIKQKQADADMNCEEIRKSALAAEEKVKAIDEKISTIQRDRSLDRKNLDEVTRDTNINKTNIALNSEKVEKIVQDTEKTKSDVKMLTEKVNKIDNLESNVETKVLTKVGEWVNKSIDEKKLDLKLVEIVKGEVDEKLKEYKDASGKVSVEEVVKRVLDENLKV